MRGGIWLGDALDAARVLAPDGEALAVLLRTLGLAAEPVAAPAPAPAPTPTPTPRRATPDPTASPEPAPPPADAPEADDHRLPSRLDPLAPATPSAPAAWERTPALTPDALAAPPVARAAPLLAQRQRRALLGALLATEVADGAPDVARIVDELAAGRPLRSLPRLPRRTLSRGAEVLVDEAPWLAVLRADQRALATYLRHLLPPERLLVRRIDGAPPEGRPPRVADGAPVLLLSDLGIGATPRARAAATPAQWQAWAQRLRRRGHDVRALVPHAPARWPAVAALRAVPWSEALDLGTVRRALQHGSAHPRSPGAPTPEAKLLELACLLAPTQRVSPHLLREARRSLHLGPGAELDFAASPWVRTAGASGVALQPEARGEARAALMADDPLRERALALVRAQRAVAGTFEAIEDRLVEHELDGTLDDAAVEQALAAATRSAAEPGATGDAVAGWAAQAWGRFSPAVRATPAARRLAFAAAARVQGRSWLMAGGGGGLATDGSPMLPEDAAALFRRLPEAALSVQLRHYADGSVNLVVGPVEPLTTALHRLHAPLTGAVWLQVQAGDEPPRTLRCEPGTPLQVDVPAETPVILRTLEGRAWRLAPDTPEGQLHAALLMGEGLPHGAVVVAAGLAVAPMSAGQVPEVVQRLADGQRARTVPLPATPAVGINGATFLRLLEGEAWPVLDASARPAQPRLSIGSPAQLFPLGPEGSARPHDLVYAGEGSYEQHGRGVEFDQPAMLMPCLGRGWGLVLGGRFGPQALDSLAAQAWAAAEKTWTARLWAGTDGGKDAFALYDGLVGERSPLSSEPRFEYDYDGRLASAPSELRGELDRHTALVLVGVRDPARELPAPVVQALQAGKPFVLVAPPEAVETWPTALRERALRNRIAPRPDPSANAHDVLAWSPWHDLAPTAAPVERTFATSVRSRFAELAERPVLGATGLFRIVTGPQGWQLVPASPPADGQPLLLFVHGEAGSIDASFGRLLRDPAHAARLSEVYAGRLFGFQYRSLSVGPLANAIALVQALAPGSRMHLVTHSGGGLLGELMVMLEAYPLAATEGGSMASQTMLPPSAPGPGAGLGRDADRALARLQAMLAERRPRVDRFVRIACPAGGTHLYGDGVDRTLSMMKMVPMVGTMLSMMPGLDRLLGDPEASPGLTALHPDDGLPPILARLAVSGGRLRVLAAAREGGGLVSRAVQGLTRWLVRAGPADDMVVPLASALAGIERPEGVDVLVDRGPDASHFAFDQRPELRQAIVDAILTSEFDVPPGFERVSSLAEARARHAPAAQAA